jgi:hypothetical protein
MLATWHDLPIWSLGLRHGFRELEMSFLALEFDFVVSPVEAFPRIFDILEPLPVQQISSE